MFNKMRKIVDTLEKNSGKFTKYLPKEFNPEMKLVNSLAASFALLVYADRVAEEEEMEAVSEYLIDMDIIIQKGLVREVAELFLQHTDKLQQAHKSGGVVEMNIVAGEMLQDISVVKEHPEYKDVVKNTVELVTSGGSADAGEVKTRERILNVLK